MLVVYPRSQRYTGLLQEACTNPHPEKEIKVYNVYSSSSTLGVHPCLLGADLLCVLPCHSACTPHPPWLHYQRHQVHMDSRQDLTLMHPPPIHHSRGEGMLGGQCGVRMYVKNVRSYKILYMDKVG